MSHPPTEGASGDLPLAERQCVPCRGGVPPLPAAAVARLAAQLPEGWQVVDDHHLMKVYPFKNFVRALEFTNRLGGIAEEQGHHPDLLLQWGQVTATIYTHAIDGLTEADFILAARFG